MNEKQLILWLTEWSDGRECLIVTHEQLLKQEWVLEDQIKYLLNRKECV